MRSERICRAVVLVVVMRAAVSGAELQPQPQTYPQTQTQTQTQTQSQRALLVPGKEKVEQQGLRRARRSFDPYIGSRWIGNAISYGPHRDGQRPGGASPTREQLRDDLRIMSKHWNMLRMYGSRDVAEVVLGLIREEGLDMKVMVGAWIGTEARVDNHGKILEEFPETVAANRAEVKEAIRLANEYPKVVVAVNVGNETQVSWSFHKVRTKVLIDYIRQVRAGTKIPVTTADDFSFWNLPSSESLAREVDFIVAHAYAMWRGQQLENAIRFTKEKYAEVVARHPGLTVVLGEAGWATQKHNQGEQATLIKGRPGEAEQRLFHDQFIAWTTKEKIANFYFEAFDENWKGGSHPNEVEKHWGLYRADRTPKRAMGGSGVVAP